MITTGVSHLKIPWAHGRCIARLTSWPHLKLFVNFAVVCFRIYFGKWIPTQFAPMLSHAEHFLCSERHHMCEGLRKHASTEAWQVLVRKQVVDETYFALPTISSSRTTHLNMANANNPWQRIWHRARITHGWHSEWCGSINMLTVWKILHLIDYNGQYDLCIWWVVRAYD